MKFLVDENVKFRLANKLKKSGHDVGLISKGKSDSELASIAKAQGRIILTHDLDFSDSFKFPPAEYSGIVVFRVFPPTFENISESFDDLLKQLNSPKDFAGKLILLERETFRVKE